MGLEAHSRTRLLCGGKLGRHFLDLIDVSGHVEGTLGETV